MWMKIARSLVATCRYVPSIFFFAIAAAGYLIGLLPSKQEEVDEV
jgi:hypothetical protein